MKTENEEDNILLKLLKIRDDKLRSWKLVKLHINEAKNEVQHFQNAISTIESFLHDNTWELSPGDQEDWLLWLDINREELLEAVEYYNKCKEDEIQASINYETANEKYKWTKERIISGQFGYISDENMDSPKEITLELIMLSFWNKTRSVTKVLGETNCRKYLLPDLQLIFDRGKGIWSFPTSTLRWKHKNDLQIIISLCKMYGLVIEIFLLLIYIIRNV